MKQGRACVDCLPSRQDACCNTGSAPALTATSAPSDPGCVMVPDQSTMPTMPTVRTSTTSNSVLPNCSVSIVVRAPSTPAAPPLPSLESVLRLRVSTLRHVPKASRDAWAGVVGDVCRTIVSDPNNVDSWVKFFMLARCILANPSRGGRSHWRDTQKAVMSRITKWRAGQLSELWDDVIGSNNRLNKHLSRRCNNSTIHANINRAHRAVEDGQYRKALQFLSSTSIAPSSMEVLNSMVCKHPQSAPPLIPTSPIPPPVHISELDVARALKSFPNGTAPGPSCLRANHLKEAVFCPSPIRAEVALKGLVGIVNLLSAGCAPRCIIPFLCGASLIACQKKDGGLRPIAIGEVLRRLTSKCVARAVQSEAVDILSPLQVGVGIPAGCEAIVHSLASLLNNSSILPESRCVLLVDFSNAFNSIDRGHMFEEARSRIPSISSWLECCYSSQPLLFFGEHTILSCCGVQQGDPLGPLGFALALHPIVERIKREVPGLLLNSWYLDDGTLCGSISDICSALDIIETDGPSRGLFLNRSKSHLFVPAEASCDCSSFPPQIPVSSGGFHLLGSPFGSPSFCTSLILKRVEKIKETLTSLKSFQDSQIQFTLLRSCLSLPKISFALRTCVPQLIKPALVTFDESMRIALSDIVGGPIPEWSWLKASLPCSLGGLGLRQALLHAPAAYIGSWQQCYSLMSAILEHSPAPPLVIPGCVSALAESAGRPEWSSLQDIDVPLTQRALSKSLDIALFDAILDSAPDIRSKALTLSSSIPHAGDWLNVIPSRALGLHFLDREHRVCLRYWLGLPMFGASPQCSICHVAADRFGDHHVGCGGNGDRIFRHNSIRDAIFSAAQSAALAPRKELPSLIPGCQNRPADVFLPHWDRGLPAALDISVISTLQQRTLQGAAETQGYALSVCEERKMAAHAVSCRAVGVSFIPLAIESLGGWSELGAKTISHIGRLLGQRLGICPSTTSRHLFQRCSVSLWRGNAALWLNRFPPVSSFIDSII